MAIYHLHAQIIGRGEGRSAVASAAYRHCARMEIEREARIVDYSAKQGLAHSEFAMPGNTPPWLRTLIDGRDAPGASAAFWNKVEAFEKRSDAQFMREIDLALPRELTRDQNIELVRAFVSAQITSRGMVADWAYHEVADNPHVHLMTSLRPLTEDGFGAKRVPVIDADGQVLRTKSKHHPAGKIVYSLWAGDDRTLCAWRESWAALQTIHLARHGIDIRVDHRSFADQCIDLQPTTKIGVGARHIVEKLGRDGLADELDRMRLFEEARTKSAAKITRRPEIILDMVARERSVFDERDLARLVHRYVDDADAFASVMARLIASPELVQLRGGDFDMATGGLVKARLATRAMIRTEAEMAEQAQLLAGQDRFAVEGPTLSRVFADYGWLNDEQKTAIEYVTGPSRIAAIVGLAGAGKTTALKAAREAWQRAGYRVVGGALAGKAAEGLEKEAGIASRTLASWELAWDQDRETLGDRSVFVMDEAGMVASRQMALFVDRIARAGAKLVLVGDGEQLQPIEAGAAFRVIHDRVGYVVLETIRRQKIDWMRQASIDFARGRTTAAIDAYRKRGKVRGSATKLEAMRTLIGDWNRDYDPSKTSLILAHLRRDVRMLNDMARTALIERGVLGKEKAFETDDGPRHFAAGDQIVFLRNESALGVKNGMIGRVMEAGLGKITVELGSRQIEVAQAFYRNVDHGYATTIHKSQGATVDQVKVLASLSLDKHLSYVAMTRHREDVALYFGKRSFAKAGGLVSLLSRRAAKETTLDYVGSSDYRAALCYATTRGLHAVRVAKSLLVGQARAIVTAKGRLAILGARLARAAAQLTALRPDGAAWPRSRLGASNASIKASLSPAAPPLVAVAGRSAWRQSILETVKETLMSDDVLRAQWRDLSQAFARIYRDPQSAAKAMNIDAVVETTAANRAVLDRLAADPSWFGALNGKAGLLATKEDREERRFAQEAGPVLRDQIEAYAVAKAQAALRLGASETDARQRASIDIPALSAAASVIMEKVRDAIDRNDLPAALGFALSDKMVKAEIDRVGSAVAQRFGERALLGISAKSIEGVAFKAASEGLRSDQKLKLAKAWPTLRAAQQLAIHERTVEALKQSDGARQIQRPSMKAGL